MNTINAFVAHSFDKEDAELITIFLAYMTSLSSIYPHFTWQHAEQAEPKNVADKVLSLFDGKNVLIAICTRKELVVQQSALSPRWFARDTLQAKKSSFQWKTSDWIIQEIGLAVGLGIKVILLVEENLKAPGELQGNLERIQFQRAAPEKSFDKLLQMISTLTGHTASRPAPAGAEITAAAPAIEKQETTQDEFSDFTTPKIDWDFSKYRLGIIHACLKEDENLVSSINDSFLKTKHAENTSNLATWSALKEYARLVLSFGGDFEKLVKLANENSQSHEIIDYLARVYANYDEHDKAAAEYLRAAGVADELSVEINLLGEAATSYQKGGKPELAKAVMEKIRKLASTDHAVEKVYLRVEKDMAELTKNAHIEIAIMERMLELNPTDIGVRFSLAYKHSEGENHAVAAWHYSRIPIPQRSGAASNNLGVSWQKLDLNGKSVEAYQFAKEKEETLAISNLANKFINEGFFDEARTLCDLASKVDNYHRNIDITKTKITEAIEEEDKKQSEFFDEARKESDFYKSLGRSLLLPDLPDLEGDWIGPDCTLTFLVKDSRLIAKGTYESRPSESPFYIGTSTSPVAMELKFLGRIFRGTIICTVTRREINSDATPFSLLSAAEPRITALMSVQDNLKEIRVLEQQKDQKTKIYVLRHQYTNSSSTNNQR